MLPSYVEHQLWREKTHENPLDFLSDDSDLAGSLWEDVQVYCAIDAK